MSDIPSLHWYRIGMITEVRRRNWANRKRLRYTEIYFSEWRKKEEMDTTIEERFGFYDVFYERRRLMFSHRPIDAGRRLA